MGLFSKKPKVQPGLIGVDIGAGGIKMVELSTEKKRLKLETYGYSASTAKEEGLLIDHPKRAADIITAIVKKSGMKATSANASLPSNEVFHSIVTITKPSDPKQPIKPLVEAQVKKLLPMPIDEMILDSTVIDKHLLPKKQPTEKKGDKKQKAAPQPAEPLPSAKKKEHIRVLVSGAPKKLVEKYVAIFKLAKLNLTSLETEAFPLIRSLVGKDKSRIMLVDIGFERTNITIVDEGTPFLHRSIKAGGAAVTNAISQQMGVSMSEAEQIKKDLASTTDGTQIPPALEQAMMPILHEIRYSLELYAQQTFHDNGTVEKIILTGGSAHLPHIDPFLTKALDMNIYVGNPWARLGTPEGLDPVLDEIGPRFSVSIGLAMKLQP